MTADGSAVTTATYPLAMSNARPGFLDDYLPFLLRRADQRLSAPFYATLTRRGVARSEWRVLAILYEHGSLSVLDLANLTLSPQPTVTHALRRLEARGLVTRAHGLEDRRHRFISVTDAGAELTVDLVDEAKRLEAEGLAGVGDLSDLHQQLRMLADYLGRPLDEQSDAMAERAEPSNPSNDIC